MARKNYIIALIPPQEVGERAIQMSERLKSAGAIFTLNTDNCFPHVSLYHILIDEESVDAVKKRLKEILKKEVPFELEQETLYPDQGIWIGARYVKDENILHLHKAVIDGTREFWAGKSADRTQAQWSELTPQQRKNVEYCGWEYAFDLYSPHMSFAKLSAPKADVLSLLPKEDFSFQASKIGLFERGQNGTCTKLLAEMDLKI